MSAEPAGRPLHVAALVKQVPVVEELRLGDDGRLARAGLPLEMSAYCRRAVAEGVLLAGGSGGTCTVVTMGPPAAEDVLREAVAYGADRGVHLCDPAFAGADTLATARALAAALTRLEGEAGAAFDLVLVGRNSVDADTGQVGPELAQLLDRPFATGVKRLELLDAGDGAPGAVAVGLEHDDAWVEARVQLPAVLSTAERLIDPCKIKDPAVWATVDPATLTRWSAADLGPGPWGEAGSPTWVGEVRVEAVERAGTVLDGDLAEVARRAVAFLADRGALTPGSVHAEVADVVPATGGPGPVVGVLVEPDRDRLTRELLTGAARLAAELGGSVVALGPAPLAAATLGTWGADEVVAVEGAAAAEDVAAAATAWAEDAAPWAVLAGSTAWGREVASRVAAARGAGLVGDAVGFAVRDGRLVGWKPAFGGGLVAAVGATSPLQMATVRAGVLGTYRPRPAEGTVASVRRVEPRGRVVELARTREDDVDELLNAEMVIGVGQGVDPARYGELGGLRRVLGAELAATRKVTDKGHLPHARQIGITGHSISPRLFVSLGTSGKYNHTVGIRSAGTVLAVNADPEAPIFAQADLGIVGDWAEVVPLLVRELEAARAGRAGA